jgi:hypothetical protein
MFNAMLVAFSLTTLACATTDTDESDQTDSEVTQELIGGGRCNAGYYGGPTLIINGWQHNNSTLCCNGPTVQTISACYSCNSGSTWCHNY